MKKVIARYRRIVTKINKLEAKNRRLGDAELSSKLALLRIQHQKGEELDKLLPEVFALTREAARRTIGLRAFNVQLQGGIGAHEGKIVEMKTGEGKTLTILFPTVLNALSGKGVHVITTNDYLAQRDAQWMEPVYRMLGLTVNFVVSTTSNFDRKVAYQSDVTYVTNKEVGFDFLRDNMVYDENNICQRGFHFAIVDEADSVLIDEAQIPLVISDSQDEQERDQQMYQQVDKVIKNLVQDQDFQLDEKEKTVHLTFNGIRKVEKLLGVQNIYQNEQNDFLYYVTRLLKAYYLFKRDRDYVVDDGKVIIVDEFTGRLMPEHRYHQGMHQAIEAKEGLVVLGESQTMASITFQYLMKKYQKLAGFTGTAQSAEREFRLIYHKEVVVIPTNRPVKRVDLPDKFFHTRQEKVEYLAWAVQEYFLKKRATLIGTRSVRQSAEVGSHLLEKNIPNLILNAKHTKREAEIVARAGQSQTVTVATNMAGRGTDIELAEPVRDLGGLIVLGLERHNARRIDNQLIGRAGRQGDPGESQFLVSAEDELIKTYFKNKYLAELKKQPYSNKGVTSKKLEKIVTKAQKRMEAVFFDQRVLNFEFDRVMESHRKAFYRQRKRVLTDRNLKEETLGLMRSEFYRIIANQTPAKDETISESQLRQIVQKINDLVKNRWFKFEIKRSVNGRYSLIDVRSAAYQALDKYYAAVESYLGRTKIGQLEKISTLKVLDLIWVNHQQQVDQLQDAALINSISRSDFFETYQLGMVQLYRRVFLLIPRVVVKTFFRTANRMLQQSVNFNN